MREALRREYVRNLWDNARLMDSAPLLHVVDADALTKCRLSMFGQIRDANRFIYRTGDEEDVQKARARVGGFNDRLEFPTEENFEKLYFDHYGEGYNGSPVPDRPGAPYRCPCGLRMSTPGIAMPDECPSCGRLTPMGEMVRDGVLRRRWTRATRRSRRP